jgi:hypothetical protein
MGIAEQGMGDVRVEVLPDVLDGTRFYAHLTFPPFVGLQGASKLDENLSRKLLGPFASREEAELVASMLVGRLGGKPTGLPTVAPPSNFRELYAVSMQAEQTVDYGGYAEREIELLHLNRRLQPLAQAGRAPGGLCAAGERGGTVVRERAACAQVKGGRLKPRWRDKPRPPPRVHPVTGGVMIDSLDEYASEVAGVPPPDFNEVIERSRKLNALAWQAFEIDPSKDMPETEATNVFGKLRDAMLLAAYGYSQSRHEGKGESPLAFVQRAKQVIQWCKRPIPEMTPLSVLEFKARELARLIAERLFVGEGFVLVLYNEQTGGHMTFISSGERASTIKLLTELAGKMGEMQRGLS